MKFLVSIILIFIFFNESCKPDSDAPCRAPNTNLVAISSFETAHYPFLGTGDTIRYTDLGGDSIWCIGAAKNIYCSCYPYKNNPSCPPDSFGYENDQFTYSDTLGKLFFTVNIFHIDSVLKLTANNSVFTIPSSTIGVRDTLSKSWYDSLQFGNRMFYYLQSFINSNGDSLYYNSYYGMIGLKKASQRFYIYSFNNR